MKNKQLSNYRIPAFFILGVLAIPHLFKAYSFNILMFLFAGSFVLLSCLGAWTTIRNHKKGTLSLNPVAQFNANFESKLNRFENIVLKYCLIVNISSILSVFIFMAIY